MTNMPRFVSSHQIQLRNCAIMNWKTPGAEENSTIKEEALKCFDAEGT
jgi:hypothetical protein